VLSLSLKVGPERAVGRAAVALGPGPLAAAAPRFAPQYLSGATRTALKERPEVLAAVREAIGKAAA
jgi:undecaprenyl-diphosphatase